MKIEEWVIDKLIPYARNPRKNDGAVDAVAASIKEFGFKQPIVVDKDGVVVAGHTRLKAAKKLKLKKVPVVVADDLTDDQIRAFRVLDNRVAQKAEWDSELLALELDEIQLDMTAFDVTFDELLIPEGSEGSPVEEDEVPEVQEDPISWPGDLWILGEHRVLCGDSTKAEDVAKLLDGRTPFIMVTDPPYGVEYDPEWRNDAAQAGASSMRGAPGGRSLGKVANDDKVDWTEAYRLFRGAVAYIWHAGKFTGDVASNIHAADFEVRAQIVWRKPHFAISRGHYHWQHEPCWYSVRKGSTAKWAGDRKQSTIWDIAGNIGAHGNKDDGTTGHGTQKPVECMARPIRNHGGKDDDVFDPFLGSGTTLIAAEQLGRKCYGLELEPKYVDVIVRRWSKLTGKPAILESSGKTFDEVAEERRLPPKD